MHLDVAVYMHGKTYRNGINMFSIRLQRLLAVCAAGIHTVLSTCLSEVSLLPFVWVGVVCIPQLQTVYGVDDGVVDE